MSYVTKASPPILSHVMRVDKMTAAPTEVRVFPPFALRLPFYPLQVPRGPVRKEVWPPAPGAACDVCDAAAALCKTFFLG